jgi:hypothetical protein
MDTFLSRNLVFGHENINNVKSTSFKDLSQYESCLNNHFIFVYFTHNKVKVVAILKQCKRRHNSACSRDVRELHLTAVIFLR